MLSNFWKRAIFEGQIHFCQIKNRALHNEWRFILKDTEEKIDLMDDVTLVKVIDEYLAASKVTTKVSPLHNSHCYYHNLLNNSFWLSGQRFIKVQGSRYWQIQSDRLNTSIQLALQRRDYQQAALSQLIELSQLTHSNTLNLDGIQAALPTQLYRLTQLTSLSINNTHINYDTLSAISGSLNALNHLSLISNNITRLPESVGQISHLQGLDISWNQFSQLPESVGKLSNLQTLNLGKNKLPENFGQLSQLKALSLFGNKLTQLTESFGQLKTPLVLDHPLNSLRLVLGYLLQDL